MDRPTTFQDLPDYDRRGNLVVSWNTSNVMIRPVIAEHIVKATRAAQIEGLEVTNDGIYEVLTVEQLEAKLLAAGLAWDRLKAKYETLAENPAKVDYLWQVNNWARENGRPKIEVEEESKAKADFPF